MGHGNSARDNFEIVAEVGITAACSEKSRVSPLESDFAVFVVSHSQCEIDRYTRRISCTTKKDRWIFKSIGDAGPALQSGHA